VPEEIKKAKWTITISGNEWGTVRYGIVEYLRSHPALRASTAILGLVWILGYIATAAGFKWHNLIFPSISTFFVTPTLLWLAVVSGPDFQLVFPPPKTPDATVTQSVPPKGLLDPETYGIEALNNSFVSTEGYARSSFRWAITSFIAAFCGSGVNIWFRVYHPSALSTGHEELFIWISSLSLALFGLMLILRSILMFRRATVVQDKLLEFQKAITAIKYIEGAKNTQPAIDPAMVVANLLPPRSVT